MTEDIKNKDNQDLLQEQITKATAELQEIEKAKQSAQGKRRRKLLKMRRTADTADPVPFIFQPPERGFQFGTSLTDTKKT